MSNKERTITVTIQDVFSSFDW